MTHLEELGRTLVRANQLGLRNYEASKSEGRDNSPQSRIGRDGGADKGVRKEEPSNAGILPDSNRVPQRMEPI